MSVEARGKRLLQYLLNQVDKIVLSAVIILVGALILLGLGYYNYANILGAIVFILFVAVSLMLVTREIADRRNSHLETEENKKTVAEPPRKETNQVLVAIFAGFLLLIFAFRKLIAQPGIVNATYYALWQKFSIVESLPFNPLMGYSAGNDRFFISGIFYELPLRFINSIAISNVVQTFLTFAFLYTIAVLVSRSVYSALNLKMNRAFFYTIFGFISLMNPVFLVDGWLLSVAALLILYVLIVVLRNLNSSNLLAKDAYKVGYVASFIIFIDPRYFILLFISLAILLLLSAVYGQFKKVFVLILRSSVIWVPSAILLIIMFYFTSTFAPNYVTTVTVGHIEFYSVNSNYISVWAMLGNWWPSVFASPQIVTVSKSQIYLLKTYGYSLPMMVMFKNWFQAFWTVLFGMYSIVTLVSLSFLRKEKTYNRRLAIFLIPFIILFILVLGGSIGLTPIVQVESDLSRIPFIGGIWGITIAVSPWLQSALFAFFLLFFSYSISKMFDLNLRDNNRLKRPAPNGKKRLFKYAIVSIVVLLALAPSWQFAFPQYSLGAADPGLPGNHISVTGSYYPSYPPSSFIGFYSYLSSSSNLTYSVFSNDQWSIPEKWDSGILSIGPPGVPPSQNFSDLFSYVYQENLYMEVGPLCDLYGVKYFFIDNSTVKNITPLVKFLKETSLVQMYSGKNLSVFEDPAASNVEAANVLIGYSNESNVSLLEAYAGLRSVSLTPAFFSGSGMPLVLGDSANLSEIALLNYQNFRFLRHYLPPPFNNTTHGDSNSTFINLNGWWNIFIPGNNYYANYGTANDYLKIMPETGSGQSIAADVILEYKAPMFDGAQDIPVPDYNNTVVVVSGEIKYSVSGNDSGIGLFFPTNNASLVNGPTPEVTLPDSGSNVTENFTISIPAGTRAFSASLRVDGLKGTIDISKLNISYSLTHGLSYYVGNMSNMSFRLSKGSYSVVESGLNNNFKAVRIISTYSVDKATEVSISTQNLSYLSYIIVIPANMTGKGMNPVLNDLSYSNLTAKLSFKTGGNAKYVLVSYSPQYDWHPSTNMKFLGTNGLGIQIYEILEEGESSLYIPGSFALTVAEIVTAVAIDAAIPIWLFVMPSDKKRGRVKNRLN